MSSCVSHWLFLRLLGLVYLSAFVSLWVQIDGLIGSDGILPVREYLAETPDSIPWLRVPTLCWLDASDGTLHALCAGGAISAVLLTIGVLPVPMLVFLWVAYLSLTVAGQDFLSYQWDVLLLETGLLAIFYAPWDWLPRRGRTLEGNARSSMTWMRWLLRWLLFRLMFAAGLVKLASGDPSWRDLTALHAHFETQPLPSWISWHVHQAPGWLLSSATVLTFIVELGLPVLLFGPPRWRHIACFGIAGFQVLILLTGNFGFFNLLTIVLCVAQIDDATFPAPLRRLIVAGDGDSEKQWRARRIATACFAGLVVLLSLLPFLGNLGLDRGWIGDARRLVAAFRSVNQYGMFAIMTTTRREIVIEGSDDGESWHAYEFRWKPGPPDRPPAILPLHLPRLDWQMWFAALDPQPPPWFNRFLSRLRGGSPHVVDLLVSNPFPGGPRFLRARVFVYRFTTRDERRQSGNWWQREFLGDFRAPASD